MLNLIGMILLSPCPFWIRFCQLSIYQKFLNLFGVENWNQSGLFDTLPSSLNLLGGAKKKTSWFHSSCQWGLNERVPDSRVCHFRPSWLYHGSFVSSPWRTLFGNRLKPPLDTPPLQRQNKSGSYKKKWEALIFRLQEQQFV